MFKLLTDPIRCLPIIGIACNFEKGQKELQDFWSKWSTRFLVFSGHFHLERSIQQQNISSYITPSTFFQIDPRFDEFQVDHYQIAYRRIELRKDQLLTNVRYFPGILSE